MKIFCKKIVGLIGLVIGVCALASNGCQNADAPTLYNPGTLPQPIVDSLSPAGGALAGIDTISVYGRNFSSDRSNDGVYFNSSLVNNASIITASQTKLTMRAPALAGDTILVRVYVIGAVDFSPTVRYKLTPAMVTFGTFVSGETAGGVAVGADTNLYVSISNANLSGTKDEGIFKISSAGARISPAYVLPTSGNISWTAIKFGPAGLVYGVKGNRAVYQLPPATSNPGSIWAVEPSGSFNDLDFDPDHNVWVGATGVVGADTTNIIRVMSDASTQNFSFSGAVKSIRFFGGYLYFSATNGSGSQVWRAPWNADTIGTPQVYFDAASVYSGTVPTLWGIAFSSDGDMFVGTDAPDYLIVVHASGLVEKPYSLYASSGVLTSPCKTLAWIGTTLYAQTAVGGILKVSTGKQGAPYYGTH